MGHVHTGARSCERVTTHPQQPCVHLPRPPSRQVRPWFDSSFAPWPVKAPLPRSRGQCGRGPVRSVDVHTHRGAPHAGRGAACGPRAALSERGLARASAYLHTCRGTPCSSRRGGGATCRRTPPPRSPYARAARQTGGTRPARREATAAAAAEEAEEAEEAAAAVGAVMAAVVATYECMRSGRCSRGG
eukprot:3008734-Prymnesium_polylepis.1